MKTLIKLLGVFILVSILLLPASALVLASEDWAVYMTVTTDPNIGSVPGGGSHFGFGARDGASDGYNSGEGDEIAPPDPMTGINAYFYYPANPPFQKNLVMSVTGPAASITWPLVVKMVGETGDAEMTISWPDISSVPAKYVVLELQDTGGTALADMRSVDHYTFSASQGQTYDFQIRAEVEEIPEYDLTISSTAGGNVTTPGEGVFGPYDYGKQVNLVATPASGYYFVNWDGDVGTIADVSAATTTITMQGDYEITARFLADVVDAKTETVTDATVDATEEADTEVEVDGTATVTVAQYEENPGGSAPTGFSSLDKYIDVYVPDTTEVTELEIRLYYTDAELAAAGVDDESLLQLLWWDGAEWDECSDSGVNTTSTNGYSGYMWAKIRNNTTPSLAQLQGTEFGGYAGPSETPGGGCFIATAAYGTDTTSELDILREYRDKVLLPSSLGARLVSIYYKTSPPIADFISRHEVLRTAVRVGFVDPIVKILTWSHDLWSA
jgi:hypothetical protein